MGLPHKNSKAAVRQQLITTGIALLVLGNQSYGLNLNLRRAKLTSISMHIKLPSDSMKISGALTIEQCRGELLIQAAIGVKICRLELHKIHLALPQILTILLHKSKPFSKCLLLGSEWTPIIYSFTHPISLNGINIEVERLMLNLLHILASHREETILVLKEWWETSNPKVMHSHYLLSLSQISFKVQSLGHWLQTTIASSSK